MSLQLLFPSRSIHHAFDPPTEATPPPSKHPLVQQRPSRAEWIIASVIVVVALVLVLLFIGPPHVI
ncbi:MAG TPA: hypothetical protein VHW68_00985 [Actinomycetota bacterium]|nr:hypothetical protein [Actinomycetota bacterium]